ncbi:MAG TPA: hypothetical protein VGC99_05325 [Candidatus Tectomicrobia bacterium]
MAAYSTCLIPSEITWEHARPVAEQEAVQAALTHPSLLDTTLTRLYAEAGMRPASVHLTVRYLATGGAKRVYVVTAHTQPGGAYAFVLKQFLPIRLAHLPPGASVGGAQANADDLDTRLLEHMVWAARRVDEVAPGLCPRFGGLWEWSDAHGQRCRAMTEAYIEGHSLERWKGLLEDAFVQGELVFAEYSRQRQALERQGIAAYVRLWAVLGRHTFTSDPSPWNVLLTPTIHGFQPSIIDLHSIHDGGSPLYVFQTLEELFGSRDEIRQHALCPGILDALGRAEGVRFLESVKLALAAQSAARERAGLSPYTSSIQAISRFLESPPKLIPEPASTHQRC